MARIGGGATLREAILGRSDPGQKTICVVGSRLAAARADLSLCVPRLGILTRGRSETAWQVIAQIGPLHFGFDNVSTGVWIVLGVAAAMHLTPKDWLARLNGWFCQSPGIVQAAALAGLVMAIQYVSATGGAPFVYTNF